MNIPFRKPKFSIEGKKVCFSFSVYTEESAPLAKKVIDYWELVDDRGRRKKVELTDKSNCVILEKRLEKIELEMKDAGKEVTYDHLRICVHFLSEDNQSIAVYYEYQVRGDKFSYSNADILPMSENEKETMIGILTGENDPEPPGTDDTDETVEEFANKKNVFMSAVDKEMRFLRNSGGKRYKITNGQFVMQSQGGFIYSFDLDAELFLAEDSPVAVYVGLDKISGVVLVCENFQIIIALEKIPYADRSLKILKAEISADPWKLLEKLNERLWSINLSDKIAKKLLTEGPRLASLEERAFIARGQETAIQHAISSPITIVWGPPGTGKTYTIAQMAQHFLSQGKNILIVSHSNVSVDNVAKQIYNQIKDGPLSSLLQQSKVLRYGYVRDEELQKNKFVASFKVAIKESRDNSEFERLQAEYKELTEKAEASTDVQLQQRIFQINQAIKAIKTKYKDVEKHLVSKAQLVATTVSKIYADPLFERKLYDVVMFDEISMAYVPQIVAAASFATERLICVGDFRQLAPIVQDPSAKAVLGKDLFEYLNISKNGKKINAHPWLVMLDEQRRMHPAISAYPSEYIYNGLLKDHPSVFESRNAIAKTLPFGEPMGLIDLYGTCCFGSKNEDNSRFNILSAVFALATALQSEKDQGDLVCADEEKVGIITPYAAQTRLIKAMIQDYRQGKKKTNVSCATVHQFQGSERNVVIFDSVESHPSTRAGWLMSKNEGGSVTRLINVALTRSRGKFIVIANRPFWLNGFGPENEFASLVRYMKDTSPTLNYLNNSLAEYIQAVDMGRNIKVFTSAADSNSALLDDIRAAKNKILLMIPKGKINEQYAEAILQEIYERSKHNVSAVIVYDKTVAVPLRYQDLSLPSDKVTMPILFVDSNAWYGLPIYKHDCSDRNRCYPIVADVIVRFSGKYTVEMIKSLVEHTSVKAPPTTRLAMYIKNHYTCSKCGEPMMLVKANKHFIRCKKCGKTQALSVEMVNDYLDSTRGKCSRCGREMYAVSGQYGIYVRCCNNHPHKLDEI